MLVYIISSNIETERLDHINKLKSLFSSVCQIEAIYPSKVHVPFLQKIKDVSRLRTGVSLTNGALGCLLSHRKVWRSILNQNEDDNFIILESDSLITNSALLLEHYKGVSNEFDLFFWGAFDGRMKLFSSSKKKYGNHYIGKPYFNSLYCTYGYMINKKAATYLLNVTSKFDFPVDYWKYRLRNTSLKIGGITPNLITTIENFESTIEEKNNSIFHKIFDFVVDCKNVLITTFK